MTIKGDFERAKKALEENDKKPDKNGDIEFTEDQVIALLKYLQEYL